MCILYYYIYLYIRNIGVKCLPLVFVFVYDIQFGYMSIFRLLISMYSMCIIIINNYARIFV